MGALLCVVQCCFILDPGLYCFQGNYNSLCTIILIYYEN